MKTAKLTQLKTQSSKCDSFKVARIIYGMTDFTDRLEMHEKRGKIVFGGCSVTGNAQNTYVPNVEPGITSAPQVRVRTENYSFQQM